MRAFRYLAAVAVAVAGFVTGAASPAQAIATAPCDPAGVVTAADRAFADHVRPRLTAAMRSGGNLNGYTASCARQVVAAVEARRLDRRAAVIAITTTIVEGRINNYSEEVDHDSLGLFQQRASWGSRAQRLDPTWATNAFLNRMLQLFPDGSWRTRSIGSVCQSVQVSAFPERYQPEAPDAQVIVAALWGRANQGLHAADLTGDGRADIVVRHPDGTLRLYPNTGNAAAPYAGGGARIGEAFQQFDRLAVADLSGDGRADLVARERAGNLRLYVHTGDDAAPYTGAGIRVGTGFDAFDTLLAADLTGDGRADLLGRQPNGTLNLYVHNGDSTTPYTGGGIVVGSGFDQLDALAAGDVTGDGRADLVVRQLDGTLRMFANSGTTSAPWSGVGAVIGTGFGQFTRLVLADVTGDRRADLLAVGQAGTVHLFTNSGDTAAPYTGTGTQVGSGFHEFF